MATVNLTVNKVDDQSVDPTEQAMSVADTYVFRNDGRTLLYFEKTGAGAANITVTTPGTVGGLAVADRTFAVEATTGKRFASFKPGVFNDVNGDVSFVTDEDTGLSVVALRIA